MTTSPPVLPRVTSFALERVLVRLASGQAPAAAYADTFPGATHGAEDVISRALLHTGCFEEASAPLHNGRPDSDDPEPADAQRPGRGPLDLSGGAKAPADVVDPAGADALVSPRYSTQRLPERS